jgi:hypothetical protein
MSYRLEAVIGSVAVLSAVTRGHPAIVVAELRQGLGLVPMTGRLAVRSPTWRRSSSAVWAPRPRPSGKVAGWCSVP